MPFGQGGGFAGGGGGGGGGAQGAQGAGGAQGAQGSSGGAQGSQGAQGSAGAQGTAGAQGSVGAQGNQGFQGAIGAQGLQGSQGGVGAQGSTGAQGSQGATGAQGSQGFQGNQGNQGFQGTLGPLTQDVTTSGNVATLVGTSNVESIIRANTLDQMGAPAANLSMNSKRLTTMGQGIVGTDAPDLAQLAGIQYPYVVSGCVWTPDSGGATLAGSMTAGSIMIKGILLTVAAVTSRTFAASVDTYVDLQDNGDGTAAISYSTVGNNAASPALANSGTILNTLRDAIIQTTGSSIPSGAAAINQGSTTVSAAETSPQTSTVAAGSNGSNITASTLAVAANSLPAAGAITIAHSTQTYTLAYTGGGGTTTLTGVTVIAGSGTVSTGDVVTTAAVHCVTDSLGNLIFNTNPNGGLIGCLNTINAFTTTSTSAVPMANNGVPMIATYIIPPGPSRRVKVWLNLPLFGSSATAGTTLTAAIQVGNNTANICVQQPKVNVASDQTSILLQGLAFQAPGTYTAQVWLTQGAAGTLTAGIAFATTQLAVELI